MERKLQDTLSWKLELMKKRVSSLRDSLSCSLPELTPMETCVLHLKNMLKSRDNRVDEQKVSEIVRVMEDLVDEIEYEMLCSKYEILDHANSTSIYKRISKKVGHLFSGMVTILSNTGSGQEFGLEKEQTEVSNNRIKKKFACEEEAHELVGRMGEVVEKDDCAQNERVVVFRDGELWEPIAEESMVSSCLHKRKIPYDGQAVGFTSLSDSTKRKVNGIVESVNALVKDFSDFTLHNGGRKRPVPDAMVRESSPIIDDERIFGRVEERDNILKALLSENGGSNDAIFVLPITGMGGIGKTTLAKFVYADVRVRHHFGVRVWHWASMNFDLVRLMRRLIEFFTNMACEISDMNHLCLNVDNKVMGKNVLIVVDDVWDVTQRDWELFMSSLRSAKSVRILVTTRHNEVARVVQNQTMRTYSLVNLPFNDCWDLFKQVSGFDIATSVVMIEMGKKIVKMCGGLPLSIKTIGGVLRYKMNIERWRDVLDSDIWDWAETRDVLPALSLSYRYLPETLKPCFVVFSLFPQGFAFSKDDVIRIWMSLNLLENENNVLPEDTGSSYFDELLERSLIERDKYNKRQNKFVMHDLVHDLAHFVALEDFSRIESESLSIISNVNVRYLSVVVNNLPNTVNLQVLKKYNRLRILKIINSANKWNNIISVNISNEQLRFLKYLCALDFSHTGIEVLPYSIGNLRLLRYLNLSNTNIKRLPESLCSLYNLQTLELRDCSLQELPRGIKNLVNLRHLNLLNKNTCMPSGIGALINLQTLPIFNIRNGGWHCKISELKGLVNLCGELSVTGLRNITSVNGVKEANLRNKEHIEVLSLDWTIGDHVKCNHSNFKATSSTKEQCSEEEVLEWLQPNTGLEELHIHAYSGSIFPNWMRFRSFYKLSKITINGCGENCEFLPSLGLLPSLKSLSIQWIDSIQRIGREFCSNDATSKGFQSLETLEFKYLPNWVEWFGVEKGEFIKLNTLSIVCCNELQSLPQPFSSSLTKLLISNCGELSVLPYLPSLTRLSLNGKLSDSLLHNLHVKYLRFLKISSSESITCIPLNGEQLPSLEVLLIKGCTNLEYILGVSSMTSLKRLEIVQCQWVQIPSNEEISHLLQHLTISRCPLLQEWYQEITLKYKIQLSRSGNANDEIKTVDEMCVEKEGIEDEVTAGVARNTENDMECEMENTEAKKSEKGKNVQSDEMYVEHGNDKMIVNEIEEMNDVEREKKWIEAERRRKGKNLLWYTT